MKVTITHMKAPWPAGAGVGDTVELDGEAVPAWATGKCLPAADDAEVFAPAAGEAMQPVEGDTLTAGDAAQAQAEAPAEGAAPEAPAEAAPAAATRKGGKTKAQAEAPAEG